MVRVWLWVLAGLLLYMLGVSAVRARGWLPSSVRVQGPITTLHTKRGREFLERLATPRRFWRAWGNFGVGVALVVMVGSFIYVVYGTYAALQNPQPTPLNQPRNVLAIPGVNDFLPLSVAPEIVAGLVLGLIVHEGGHGLLCRVEDIDIESMGLALLTIIPIGAFVEPNEESRNRADRGAQTRMFAAGVINNFALAAIAFALLVGPVIGAIAVVPGVHVGGVVQGSAAAQAGIEPGSVITGVENRSVTSPGELNATLANEPNRSVSVTLAAGSTVRVDRSVVVTAAAADAPLAINTTIAAVNGTEVYTEPAFERAARNRSVGELRTSDGENVTTPLGTYALVSPDSPFADAGAPAGESIVVTEVEGQRTLTGTDLMRVLDPYQPGDRITVVGYVDGARRTYEVELGQREYVDGGYLGVRTQRGISGFSVDEFGIRTYPAGEILGLFHGTFMGESISPPAWLIAVLGLPFYGSVPGLFEYSFPGFTGIATNFYTVEGPLGALGSGFGFVLANVLFWTAWINVIIGQFNLIPSYPLDGGHILRTSAEAIISRLPIEQGRRLTTAVTMSITVVMISALLLLIFGPGLLAG